MPTPQTTATILAQAAAPTIPLPTGDAIGQFGMIGVMGYLVLEKGLGWFSSKEKAESDLVATLIADSRKMQETLLNNLFSLHEQQHKDLSEVKEKLGEICDRLDKLL